MWAWHMRYDSCVAFVLLASFVIPIDRWPDSAKSSRHTCRVPGFESNRDSLSSQVAQMDPEQPLDYLYKSKDKSLDENAASRQCVFDERQDVGRKDWVGRKIASLSFGPLSLISPTAAPPRTRSGPPGVGRENILVALRTALR